VSRLGSDLLEVCRCFSRWFLYSVFLVIAGSSLLGFSALLVSFSPGYVEFGYMSFGSHCG